MSRLRSLALNPDGFAFDPTTGESFTLNVTALAILEGLREDLDHDQLSAHLVERFDVSEEEASRDLADFIAQLRAFRVL